MSPFRSEALHKGLPPPDTGKRCLVVRSLRLYQPRRRDASEVADASAGLFHTQLAFAAPTAPLSLKTHLWGLFPALAPSPLPLQL